MEKYLNTPIKEVITKFPNVGTILDGYNIGCVPCSVGSCLLKDIVEIHNLSAAQETELLTRIAAVIYPGKKVAIPKLERKAAAKASGALTYSPPVKELVEEHVLIKRWLALIPEVIADVDVASKEDRELILGGVDFIRSYADKFHHAKEEDILFKYFDPNLDIIKVMLEDHETGRAHVRAVVEAVGKQDTKALSEHLGGYMELLKQHIKKEDEILYPWMDRNLTTRQIGEMFAQFQGAKDKLGTQTPERCRKFVEEAEKKFAAKENKKSKERTKQKRK